MEWTAEKAFDLAAQSATQIMSLAVGVLALIAASKVATDGQRWQKGLLSFAWLCYFFSFFAGMRYLLAATGAVAAESERNVTYGIVKPPERILKTNYGDFVFVPDRKAVAVREIRRDANGTVLQLVETDEPSVWSETMRIPMLVEIFTFALGSVAVAIVFLYEIAFSKKAKPGVAA